MPDELETLLRAQRLDFDQPPMAGIAARARVLRRRRRAAWAGTAALAAALMSAVVLLPRDTPPPQVAASPSVVALTQAVQPPAQSTVSRKPRSASMNSPSTILPGRSRGWPGRPLTVIPPPV